MTIMDFKSVLSKPKEQLSPHNSTGRDDLSTNCKVDILLHKIFGDVSVTKKVTHCHMTMASGHQSWLAANIDLGLAAISGKQR